MFLLFPASITIPESLERLRDSDFEDWLTAALIESVNQQSLVQPNSSDEEASSRGATDLWMLEIPERTGKIWRGSFRVEFETESNGEAQNVSLPEPQGEVMSFALNTTTGEIKIDARAKTLALGA
jgi:hypothetical protein